jgi:hypothetical protein
VHLHDLISRIRKTEAELAVEFKRKPTADEVAEVTTPAVLLGSETMVLHSNACMPQSMSSEAERPALVKCRWWASRPRGCWY